MLVLLDCMIFRIKINKLLSLFIYLKCCLHMVYCLSRGKHTCVHSSTNNLFSTLSTVKQPVVVLDLTENFQCRAFVIY